MPIRVLVSGRGAMGREVLLAICREPDLEPVGVLSRSAAEEYLSLPDGSGLVPFSAEPASLFTRTRPQVVVDFTNAEWTPAVARETLAAGACLVSGTSGLSEAFLNEMGRECEKHQIGAVIATNFAIGAVLMIYLAKIASRFFTSAEIIEQHHDRKVDAPSGTAISTARSMASAREEPFQQRTTERETLPGSRGANLEGIAIHSIRLPGLMAHQEVILGAPGQTLTIRHDSLSRESFMPGVLFAIREVIGRKKLVLGLERLIGLE